MTNMEFFIDKGKNASEYSRWPIHEKSFDRGFSPIYLGQLTTCAVLDDGKSLARFLSVHGPFLYNGWKNTESSNNVTLLENAYNISNQLEGIQKNDLRIHVPKPHGLYLVRQQPFGSLHPSFVMDYIPNHFFNQDLDKQKEIIHNRDEILKVLENKHGFDTGPHSKDNSNFIYNSDLENIYLIGFGLWKRK